MGITLWNFPQMHMLLRMTNGKTENIANLGVNQTT